jgi:hypothetical protein
MVFAAMNPRQRAAGTSFENVAEEFLNGLFCHYEPPTSEYTQHKAATKAKLHPEKYSFSQVKKTQSILRTSRLYRKKHAVAVAVQPVVEAPTKQVEAPTKKAVTWRDEKKRKGLEGKVESCAVNNCGFLGFSSGGEGLADSMSPTQAKSVSSKESQTAVPEPILKPTPTSREPLKEGPPKKVLYDDEGNPISEDSSLLIPDENQPPGAAVPPAPTGLSQLRKMATQLGDDIYEPEDYNQPNSKKAPVRNATPRHTVSEEDNIELQRSMSPPSTTPTPPNHYDTPEQFEEKATSYGRALGRPGTPHRVRKREGRDTEYTYEDNSIVEHDERDSNMASPSRRSEVFSDLTMDEALSRRKYPASPAKTSEGVEVDMIKALARHSDEQMSRQTSRDNSSAAVQRDDEGATRQATKDTSSAGKQSYVYDDMGNLERRSAVEDEISDLPRKSSTEEKREKHREKHRRHSSTEPPIIVEGKDTSGVRKQSRSRRISEPLPVKSRSRKEDDGFQQLRKVAPRSAVPVVQTVHSPEEEKVAASRRDPTPRMSMEPASGEENEPVNQGPLPPTPRQKDEGRRSSRGTMSEKRRGREEDPRDRLHRSIRAGLQQEDERRTRLSRSREARITEAEDCTAPPSAIPSPQPNTNGHAAPGMYDWTYKKFANPLSPTKTMATDDEIRAEVSSVGMESNTLRPMSYPNPFVKASQPTIREGIAESSDDADASTLSRSTASSQEKQPQKRTRSRGDNHPEPVKTSTNSGSTRTKKLWKGWRKAVGKVKQVVKDIDDQRIPPPKLPGYSLQPTHPTLER